MTTVCLNMIVKNESHTIIRLLESVVNIIDFFVIFDTGSSDDTIQKIEDFFNNYSNIKGIVGKTSFLNFEYNRNQALSYVFNFCDYILFLDADMVLQSNKFSKNLLTKDAYYVTQINNDISYKNLRFIRNGKNWFYKGLTHEVLLSTTEIDIDYLDKEVLYIKDLDDGGCKKDKINRDIILLKKSIELDKNESRNYFYLANSYFTKKKFDFSRKYYFTTIFISLWEQEKWFSYYRIALSYLLEESIINANYYFMEAYQICPKRLENIFFLYMLNDGKNNIRDIYLSIMKKEIDNINKDYLFLDLNIYKKINNIISNNE